MFELMDGVPIIWIIRDSLVVSVVNGKVCSDIYGPEPSDDGKMATAHIWKIYQITSSIVLPKVRCSDFYLIIPSTILIIHYKIKWMHLFFLTPFT
jgi:hypothetical protein